MRTRILSALVFAAILVCAIGAQLPQGTMVAQTNLNFPNVTRDSANHVKWSAGTVLNGAHGVSVTASSSALTASRYDCAAPGFLSCNIVYVGSTGTVSVVATSAGIQTASASGNSILAYVETSVSDVIRIVYPQQPSTATLPALVFGNCGTSTTCASPVVKAGNAVLIVGGSAAMTAGTVTITNMFPAFTSASTYFCTANSAAGTSGLTVNILSASSIIITGTSTPGPANYLCIGY